MARYPVMPRTKSQPAIAILALIFASPIVGQVPLDVLDATPRDVLVQVEGSADQSIVGQAFGVEHPATYSASGNIGTLMISAETHEQMLAGGFPSPPSLRYQRP